MTAVGVDVGTTFTAAAVADESSSQVVLLGQSSASIPTVVHVRGDETIVGSAALARGANDPDGLASGFKRLLGREEPLVIAGRDVHVETLMAAVLSRVLGVVAEQQNGAPESVALTHPANWSEYRREILRSVAASVGVADPVLVPEPCAAARFLASTDRVSDGALVAVYDFGGGTFDSAVVEMSSTIKVVGSPLGDERLGGLDFDRHVAGLVEESLGELWAQVDVGDAEHRRGLRALEVAVTAAKEQLSSAVDAIVPVHVGDIRRDVRIVRSEFESRIRPLIAQSIDRLETAIQGAGVAPGDLHAILLVGGTSRIPLIADMIQERLDVPIRLDAHPKLAIATGAALVAAKSNTDASLTADPIDATVLLPPDSAAGSDPIVFGSTDSADGSDATVFAPTDSSATSKTPINPATFSPTQPVATLDQPQQIKRGTTYRVAVGVVIATLAITTALAITVLSNDNTPSTTTIPPTTTTVAPTTTTIASSTTTVAPTTTTLLPSTTLPLPTFGSTGRPIIEGWVAVVSSGLKGEPGLEERLENIAGSTVIDTDDYVTGRRCASDERDASCGGQPPDWLPGSDAIAAIFGPFDFEGAVSFCATRDICQYRFLQRR